ncbi:hypothetical protein PISMIDRAFT_485038 [Pisolithus microcarpus 441]|uniref:Uncharacterized protein n=1 Tax=Pisolithus microcarpus 441 TaxID=765257 RepID=A0A0C9ZJS2_9AGAM|nr:hypothetical protein PISMIDRAFT_485038 [Pisolithus microcarpus 441]
MTMRFVSGSPNGRSTAGRSRTMPQYFLDKATTCASRPNLCGRCRRPPDKALTTVHVAYKRTVPVAWIAKRHPPLS